MEVFDVQEVKEPVPEATDNAAADVNHDSALDVKPDSVGVKPADMAVAKRKRGPSRAKGFKPAPVKVEKIFQEQRVLDELDRIRQ